MITHRIKVFSKTSRWSSKMFLLMGMLCVETLTLLCHTQPVFGQQHSLVNTPPILHVPDRNWRIPETEQVGRIVTRIRAEDPENNELVYGLEPHFLSNHDDRSDKENLPFRIDPVRGIVYLNESLIGRGGENFFLYITVSDGDLTAKNEVFVNILAKDNNKDSKFRTPPSVTKVVQNFSQILPPFDTLPGVLSVRNKLPINFGLNHGTFTPNHPTSSSVFNFNRNEQYSHWPTSSANSGSNELNSDTEKIIALISPPTTNIPQSTTGRIRLTAIKNADNSGYVNAVTNKSNIIIRNDSNSMLDLKEKLSLDKTKVIKVKDDSNVNVLNYDKDSSDNNHFSVKTLLIPVILFSCGIFFAAAGFFGFLYRKRICAISNKLKKKSKEEMTKKSNQSNMSSNLSDDSQNSMVMQHWNGPIAYNNRYVPWEIDPQHLQNSLTTSEITANPVNRVIHTADPNISDNSGGIANNCSNMELADNGTSSHIGSSVVGKVADHGNCRWEFPRHRLKFFNILGEGAFGQVWRCEAIDVDVHDETEHSNLKALINSIANIRIRANIVLKIIVKEQKKNI